jgi:hypothetical protein
MEDLLAHIGEINTFKKLGGDYIFYSTEPEYWTHEGVTSVEQFEHWRAKGAYEAAYRARGHKGFLPFDLDELTATELKQELTKLQASKYGKL